MAAAAAERVAMTIAVAASAAALFVYVSTLYNNESVASTLPECKKKTELARKKLLSSHHQNSILKIVSAAALFVHVSTHLIHKRLGSSARLSTHLQRLMHLVLARDVV